MNYYLEIANKYGLLINGGSDFHGKTVKPNIELGTGKDNNIRIKKLSLLDKLHKQYLKKIIYYYFYKKIPYQQAIWNLLIYEES